MIRPLELFIGLRYTRAKRRNQMVSFISMMATIGIVLGVAAMITVLSVMNGFGKELQQRILGVVSHVTVESVRGGLGDWQTLMSRLDDKPGVTGVAPYINGQGLLVKGRHASGVFIRGIDPEKEAKVSQFAENLVSGKLTGLVSGGHGIVLGSALAETLGVQAGSRVVLIHDRRHGEQSSPRLHKLTVVGIFNIGMHQHDSGLALLHIDDAIDIFESPGDISGVRMKLEDAYKARSYAYGLEYELGETYEVNHWMNRHSNFFIALKDQKRILFIVLMLVVSVAAFNIVSTLVMMVSEKQADIAILRTIGMAPLSVMMIFIFQGLLLAAIGIGAGVVLGIAIASNTEVIVHTIERVVNVNFLSPDIYPITDLPSDIRVNDIVNIVLATSVVSFLSTLYPAWRGARTQPAMALRYE